MKQKTVMFIAMKKYAKGNNNYKVMDIFVFKPII